jgi:NADH-quinone oxidoreductase subunit C
MASSTPLAWRVPELDGVPAADSCGDEVFFPTRERYVEVATALRRAGFVTASDLCAVDYLTNLDRVLPAGVPKTRFEVVVSLLSHAEARRARLRVMVPEDDPVCPTLFYVYPGTENMEREAYDLMGIRFAGHPDPSRILLPQDWEGHPLRRDYGSGRVPVQFKKAPGPR